MIEIIGQFNTARCFATTLEETAREQIRVVCDTEAFAASFLGTFSMGEGSRKPIFPATGGNSFYFLRKTQKNLTFAKIRDII